jgi:metal-responsive CopG/Arc/MetJ family transcriptional regulator
MSQKIVGVSFPPELLNQLDKLREDVPRSKFLQRLVQKSLAAAVKEDPVKA